METVTVTLEHSTGQWLPGLMDARTRDDAYPCVLFANTDQWTTLHRSKVRESLSRLDSLRRD